MKFRLTVRNAKTGEEESQLMTEADCWKVINSLYNKMIPDGKLKPVNFKLELLLDPDAE